MINLQVKTRPGILIFIALLMSVHPAFAQEAIDLKGMVDEALQNNPEILAFRQKYESASARIPQAASLNDPMLEFEHDRITADRSLMGDPMDTIAVSQEIPFPTKLYLRAKIAAKLSKMAYENYKAKEREVISNVKSAYSGLYLIYKSIDITKENKAILEQFSQAATTRYSNGRGTQAEALKAQVELAKADNELILLEQERLITQARLSILINKDPETELGMPGADKPVKLIKPIEEFYALAKTNNPELKAYNYAIERAHAAYSLAMNEFLPDFTVKYRQMVKKGKAEDGAWSGMIGVTIPLWFVQNEAFGVKEMRHELDMLKAEYNMKENTVLFDVRDAYARAEANRKLVELYETAFIPQAEQAANAALKGYDSGSMDFLTLLDSQRVLIEFKMEHYKAIANLRIALADLERAVGIDIEF